MNAPIPAIARFAEVAVDGAREPLTYAVPSDREESVELGGAVWVPLRKRWVIGVVLRLHSDAPAFPTKSLHGPTAPPFVVDDRRLHAARWLARETATDPFAALSPFLPPGIGQGAEERLRLVAPAPEDPELTPAQSRLVAFLRDHGEAPIAAARVALKSSLASIVPRLEEAGVIERTMRAVDRMPASDVGERAVRLVMTPADAVAATARAPRQRAVVDYLVQRARLTTEGRSVEAPQRDVMARTGADRSAVTALVRKGVVTEHTHVANGRAQSPGAPEGAPILTTPQADAWAVVERALADGDTTPILLHGVTGSGKTEVYLRAVAWCLRHGRSAIVLAPEIALASQLVRRVTARFPGQVAVLHSGLSNAERLAAWAGAADGSIPVIVGPRSALFAPLRDPGLIVLDEEHDSAYKQDAEPRYHSRALAETLADLFGAVPLFGSATPSVETSWRAEHGEIGLLRLPARVGPTLDRGRGAERGRTLDLPPVEVVDMRLELHRGNTSLFSQSLADLIGETLARREQAILFLNRRGLATVVLCRGCGITLRCPWCDIPLVFHADRGQLLCHRCDHREPPANRCRECGSGLNYFGAGTQRVEAEVQRLFPNARVLRWDQDVVRRRGGHESLLRRVERHEVDLVVGTQMIAKGFDLPRVTAVGVINADTLLHLPDFRSGERTFQLLTQVAGRAGRRGPGSRVVVQSYTPDHYAIRAAAGHDYAAFYAEEIDFRRANDYPPFSRLVRYVVRDADEAQCAARAEELSRALVRHAVARDVAIDLLGPTPAFAARVRGQHQWQVVLRAPRTDLDRLLEGLPAPPGIAVDVDPQSML
jgi:primosomal protein N' (replication factor Y)